MVRLIGLVLAAALLTTSPLVAQKNCRKGIPCGNSCISASKVCRIGTSKTEPMPTYVAPPSPKATLATGPELWLAQAHGQFYYRASCQAAKELPEPIYFKDEPEAVGLGYRRSQVAGC